MKSFLPLNWGVEAASRIARECTWLAKQAVSRWQQATQALLTRGLIKSAVKGMEAGIYHSYYVLTPEGEEKLAGL